MRMTEFKVGITVIAAVVVLIGSVMWLKEISLHQAKNNWVVTFPTTGGLAASDEVQVNGIRKGQVTDMQLAGDHVVVHLELASDVRLTRDSRVIIRNVGLMGEKVIAVELRTTGGDYAPRDTVAGIYEPDLGEMMGQAGTMMQSLNQVAEQLRDLAVSLNKNGKLQQTIDNFAATSADLQKLVVQNRTRLNDALNDAASVAHTAKALTTDRQAKLEKTLDDLSLAADRMVTISNQLDTVLVDAHTLASRVNAGEGTLGKLTHDEKLYKDLNASVLSLQALIEDVKRNPKKYFKFSVF